MCKLSEDTRNRLGNILIYITRNTHKPCKTKTLKLLYLLEEKWVLTAHTPLTGLPFEVWQHGPVEKDVFIELSDSPTLLKDYIAVRSDGDRVYVEALKDFDKDEFSNNELHMMEEVIRKYGSKSASELVAITHKKDSLWYKAAEENGLLRLFKSSHCNSSNVEIDFSKALAPCDAEFYKESLAIHNAANYYGA